jgi:parallel beta helix pectate lyase-like protein
MSLAAFGGTARAASPALVVPTDYPTIQAAIDAADPGDTIRVRAGTYTEQIVITKDLQIRGAGMDATVIRAPAALAPGQLGFATIVEIYDGAAVSMSRLTVAGPGAVCGAVDENGDPIPLLRAGVQVHGEAHLDFGHGAVRDIHNTPMAQCPQSGAGIAVIAPAPGALTATANIHHAKVTDYGGFGVIARGAGSSANVTHSLVAGPGHEGGAPTDGIGLVAGAVGRIAHNTVTGNICPDGMPDCGPDFFSQLQHAGIIAGGGGPGTVVTHNRVSGNQIGLALLESDEISHNVAIDNDYFGIELIGVDTGQFTLEHERVQGGGGGIWVVPLVDMTVNLKNVKLSDLSGPAVELLECVGASATVIGGPEPVAGVCPF